MRKSIDGLSAIIAQQFQMDPFQLSLFLFCGRRRDRFKALLWQGDGECKIVCVNRYCMNLLYAPYWGKQR